MRWLPFIVVIILAAAFAWRVLVPDHPASMPMEGKLLPDFTLPLMEKPDEELSIGTVSGQPFILHVFASWCGVCLAEYGWLSHLRDQGKVPVIGLNWKDTPEGRHKWLSQHGSPYSQVVIDDGGYGMELGITGTPETFIIDQNGVIVLQHRGPVTTDVWRQRISPMLSQLTSQEE